MFRLTWINFLRSKTSQDEIPLTKILLKKGCKFIFIRSLSSLLNRKKLEFQLIIILNKFISKFIQKNLYQMLKERQLKSEVCST